MLATAEALLHFHSAHRQLFLYDTFEGMPPPSDIDVGYDNHSAEKLLKKDTNKRKVSSGRIQCWKM